jgi:hypothetical protein
MFYSCAFQSPGLNATSSLGQAFNATKCFQYEAPQQEAPLINSHNMNHVASHQCVLSNNDQHSHMPSVLFSHNINQVASSSHRYPHSYVNQLGANASGLSSWNFGESPQMIITLDDHHL